MERILAALLHYGSWVASIVIGSGLVLTPFDSRLEKITTAGIVLFILLPTLRVLTMLIVFLHERDFRFAGIAALVLTIILLGLAPAAA
jgi:uncharacterized membrane protein